jgi:23S rRNA (guanosine2251-2'-O)-methyltransferase
MPDLVLGRNAVVEALAAGLPARRLLVATGAGHDPRIGRAVRQARAAGVPVESCERSVLDRAAGGTRHQGLVLEAEPFHYRELADLLAPDVVVVAVDGVTDPHNLGAIARSALAFGAAGLVVPERRAAGVTPAVWRASAGAVARLPVARVVNLPRAMGECADAGLVVVGLAADAPDQLDRLPAGGCVLVVGAEGRGLGRLVRERCDLLVRVPVDPAVESLNAAVAAGVALYALAGRRADGS